MEQVLKDIAEFLPIHSIISLCMVNKTYWRILSSQHMWHSLLRRDFSYCKGNSCAIPLPPHPHYKSHHNMELSSGLGLHLSASPTQLAVGDRLFVTTTIFNVTNAPIEFEAGHSLVGMYYAQGGLLRVKWKEGVVEECRQSYLSTVANVVSGTFILCTIKPNSFIQFKTRAKLRDLVWSCSSPLRVLTFLFSPFLQSIKKPKKWESWNTTDKVLCFPKYTLPIPRDNGEAWLSCIGLRRLCLKSNSIKLQLK
jgi:hypothetical protein